MEPGEAKSGIMPAERLVEEGCASPCWAVFYWNVAPSPWWPSISTVQGPVPEQAPVQPANDRPACGNGVKVTAVPRAKRPLQDLFGSPHRSPGGALAIDPRVLFLMVSVYLGNFLKTACTVILRVGLRLQMFPSGI